MKLFCEYSLYEGGSLIQIVGVLFLLTVAYTASGEETNSTDTGTAEAGAEEAVAAPESNSTSTSEGEPAPAVEEGGEAPAPAPAPAPTTTPATTTINPLDLPCICLGDAELLANETLANNVLKVCRDHMVSRPTSDGMGRVAERLRCGSRTPENPRWTWDSVCNCSSKTSRASNDIFDIILSLS